MEIMNCEWKFFLDNKIVKKSKQLKVSWSQKEILVSSILPKNKFENFNSCPSLLGQKIFFQFLEELKRTKSPFEINWPLER